MADLPPLKYGRVTARLVSGIGDGPDEGFAPDVEPLVGTVTFNLSARAIRVTTAQPVPTTVYPQPIIATLDTDGYLTWRGNRFVPLLATDDPAMAPTDLQWTVAFDLRTPDGYAVPAEPWRFALPAGETVDLTDLAPLVTPALNTIVTKGDKGDRGEPGPNTVPTADFLGAEIDRQGSPARLAMDRTIPAAVSAAVASSPAVIAEAAGLAQSGAGLLRALEGRYLDAVGAVGDEDGVPSWLQFDASGLPTTFAKWAIVNAVGVYGGPDEPVVYPGRVVVWIDPTDPNPFSAFRKVYG